MADTSVWIEFFRGTGSAHHLKLHDLIEQEEDLCLADIVLAETLQGIRSDSDFKKAREYLLSFPIYSMRNVNSYVEAANIYRACRKQGFTVRKPVDCLIAKIAIENDLQLFHNDRDFDSIARAIKELNIYGF